MRRATVYMALAGLLSCRESPSVVVGRIAHVGLIDCYDPATVDANGRPLSCETSAVEVVNGRVLIVSDKETVDGLASPVFWLPLEQPWPDVLSSAQVQHEPNAIISKARKIEGLAKSAEGDLVFATSDFDWPPDGTSSEPDLYNILLYWPIDDPGRAAIVHPTSNQGVISSVSLRPSFIEALKSDKYPSGPPYFKIEGLVALPNRELWFGVREVGPDYEHPDFVVTILRASYSKSNDGTVQLKLPFSVVARIDPSIELPSTDRLGLSSLARRDDILWMLTSREAPEGQVGHESYIWTARLSDTVSFAPRVVADTDGKPLKLPCKAEGLDTLGRDTVLIVCDEDRSPSTFPKGGGGRVTRRADQGVVMIVDVSGLQ
jgi:hypothetical protein